MRHLKIRDPLRSQLESRTFSGLKEMAKSLYAEDWERHQLLISGRLRKSDVVDFLVRQLTQVSANS